MSYFVVEGESDINEVEKHARRNVATEGRQAIHLHASGEDCVDGCYFVEATDG